LIFGASFNGWTTGCAMGPIFAGYMFDSTGSYRTAFLVCGLLSVAGLALTTRLTPDAVPTPGASPVAQLG